MKNQNKELSPSRKLAAKVIFAALTALKENNGELSSKEVVNEVERRVQFNEWEKEIYEKTGYTRWKVFLHFNSSGCTKAGFIIKKKGRWYLTPEGEKALKLGDEKLLFEMNKAYRLWDDNRKSETNIDDEVHYEQKNLGGTSIDEIESLAIEQIKDFINKMNPYEFQEIVAALLRAMGYYTPFVAPKGKDGGIDVIAYRDPLGTISPRIKVQVKHRDQTSNVQEIRQLMGLLQKDGDVGIFISTGGFTSDAKITAQSSHVHVELIDLDRFINLWQEFYNKMPDDDKIRLPLNSIYFLASQI
ncbi:MAG: Restriction endonuclease [Ignavibacteria bacterium]|nr:Restriction endonuclease [Ignavibacteria bacterium]